MRRKCVRAWPRGSRGFTLAEMLTGIGLFSVVGAAITTMAVGTFNSVTYQARIVDTQLDVAAAMMLLRSDFVAAGYVVDNMNQSVFQDVSTGTTSDHITFVGDVNSDNVSERVTYAVVNGQLMRTEDVWNGTDNWITGTPQPLAANVSAFTLKFYLVDPCNGTIQQQTNDQVKAGTTTYVSIRLTGTGVYKGRTISKTLTSKVTERQLNVRPECS